MLPKHFQISRALASICLGVNVELEFIRIILHSDWGLIALGRLFDLPYFSGSRIKLRTAHLLRKTIRVISAMNFPSSYCIHYYEFIHKITWKSSSPILSVCSGWHSGSRQSRGSYPYRIRFCLFPCSSERMHLEYCLVYQQDLHTLYFVAFGKGECLILCHFRYVYLWRVIFNSYLYYVFICVSCQGQRPIQMQTSVPGRHRYLRQLDQYRRQYNFKVLVYIRWPKGQILWTFSSVPLLNFFLSINRSLGFWSECGELSYRIC